MDSDNSRDVDDVADFDYDDDSLEGAVSVITNKDAREIALKAYKTRKANKKTAGRKGKR